MIFEGFAAHKQFDPLNPENWYSADRNEFLEWKVNKRICYLSYFLTVQIGWSQIIGAIQALARAGTTSQLSKYRIVQASFRKNLTKYALPLYVSIH